MYLASSRVSKRIQDTVTRRYVSNKYFLATAFQIDVLYETAIPAHSDDERRSSLVPHALPGMEHEIVKAAATAPSLPEERTQIARVRPANLTYSVDEAPPLLLTIVMGLQHVFVMSVGWIFVVVVATSIGASGLETATMIRMSMIGAGSQSRAELEGRLIPIIKGVAERNATRENPPVIFCIDEIHQLMIEFKGSSYAGIADLLKPYLTAGDIYMIGATTRAGSRRGRFVPPGARLTQGWC